MTYTSPYTQFIFEGYEFDGHSALFRYSFDGHRQFCERIEFAGEYQEDYSHDTFDAAMRLAFLLIGTSYYKAFPTRQVAFQTGGLDAWQAAFANKVYRDGLSQYIFENNLSPSMMATFEPTVEGSAPSNYKGEGNILLQSGGKDSLLAAALLQEAQQDFTSLYASSTDDYPALIDKLGKPLMLIKRHIDVEALKAAAAHGALNGHVPVTFILMSISLLQAILAGKQRLITSIGHEGAEPHAFVGELAVNHQWSKTWEAEHLFADYVARYIAPEIQIGSILRDKSELKIAELFVAKCWLRFGHAFSSCNRANYEQGHHNQTLKWCGNCPKCANSFLLFSPFVEPTELKSLFAGQDLFVRPSLVDTWRGLLGIDGAMKPFECVGEIAELRLAYHMAKQRWKGQLASLPFDVPPSSFQYQKAYPVQSWVKKLFNSPSVSY